MSEKQENLFLFTDEDSVVDYRKFEPEWYSKREDIKKLGLEGEYVGIVKNGKPHGMGNISVTLKNHPIYTYKGEWEDGYKNGNGVLIDSQGNKCEGIWKNDKFIKDVNNKDTFTYIEKKFDNGSIYKGFVKNNKFDGYGVFILTDDDIEYDVFLLEDINYERYKNLGNEISNDKIYEFGFFDDIEDFPDDVELEEKGTISLRQYPYFSGIWENGIPKIGEITFNDVIFYSSWEVDYDEEDIFYIGEINSGEFNGRGTGSRKNKIEDYTGGFDENELYHGQGELNENGRVFYIGEFEHGQYHGEGNLLEYTTYFDDTLEVDNYGFEYTGGFKKGVFHGKGKLKYHEENEVYEGEWKDGYEWNVTQKNKSGKIISRWIDGKEMK